MMERKDPKGQENTLPSYYNAERHEMLSYIPDGATSFLEIGCGSGAFGSLIRRTIPNATIIGIEAHSASAAVARTRLDQVIEMPVELALSQIKESSIDCVICNDVLEHLVDPWEVLMQLRAKLVPNGTCVASIPNIRYFPVFKDYLINGNFEYQDSGVLDRTHLRFFTKRSIKKLFEDSGYRVHKIDGIFASALTWKMELLSTIMKCDFDDMKYERFACSASVGG